MQPTPAPDFALLDQSGQKHQLSDYHGRWLVLYFYPNNRSLNCSREACDFRDEYRVLEQFGGATVVGINYDTIESHQQFAERHQLNFPILSDPGHKVTQTYGAWRQSPSRHIDKYYGTRRSTYIINPEGMIVKKYQTPRVRGHVEQVISDLQALQSND